jgi:hypothetical protein
VVNAGRQVGIAAGEDDRQVGPIASHGFDQLDACHVRHGLIGDDQIDVLLPVQYLKRPLAGYCPERGMTEIFEHRAGIHEDERVVIDREHDKRRHAVVRRPKRCGRPLAYDSVLSVRHRRQPKLGNCAFA